MGGIRSSERFSWAGLATLHNKPVAVRPWLPHCLPVSFQSCFSYHSCVFFLSLSSHESVCGRKKNKQSVCSCVRWVGVVFWFGLVWNEETQINIMLSSIRNAVMWLYLTADFSLCVHQVGGKDNPAVEPIIHGLKGVVHHGEWQPQCPVTRGTVVFCMRTNINHALAPKVLTFFSSLLFALQPTHLLQGECVGCVCCVFHSSIYISEQNVSKYIYITHVLYITVTSYLIFSLDFTPVCVCVFAADNDGGLDFLPVSFIQFGLCSLIWRRIYLQTITAKQFCRPGPCHDVLKTNPHSSPDELYKLMRHNIWTANLLR